MTEDNEPAILLGRMPQQTEVRVQEEDWTGKTDAAARRKLQNRLNQRIWRNRRKAERLSQVPKSKPSSSIGEVGHIPTSAESPDGSTTQSQEPEAVSGRVGSRTGRFSRAPARPNPCFNDLGPAGILELMRQYEITAYQAHLLGSPRVDELLTLIQFNVFRALISNTSTLGFSMGWLQEDATSPWSSTCEPINSSCPASLQPTLVQRMIPHHPWIDLFPIPRMRDNMLLAGDSFDEYELCNDLVDFCDVPSERTGLVIWGEPWDPSGWEMGTCTASSSEQLFVRQIETMRRYKPGGRHNSHTEIFYIFGILWKERGRVLLEASEDLEKAWPAKKPPQTPYGISKTVISRDNSTCRDSRKIGEFLTEFVKTGVGP